MNLNLSSRYLSAFGKPTFLLGSNYWSSAGGPRMWESERFDEATIERELDQMGKLGLNACRMFAFLPTFMPLPMQVDGNAVARMKQFVAMAEARKIALLPSLLVGHMSGENYDFPMQAGRSPYSDAEVLSWQVRLAEVLGEATSGSPSMSAWVLSNEMPLWGGRDSVFVVTAWALKLTETLHKSCPGVPVGTGDGYMNGKGGQNGFDPEALGPVVDYYGPHAYYGDTDALRQSLYYEYLIRSLQPLGKPVLFEEFGCSSQQAGQAEQAALWREIIATCMGTGAAGALGWCFGDFALTGEPPYSHHAFELEFGAVRHDGSEKRVCEDLRKAGKLVRELPWTELDFDAPKAAIIRPSYTETTYPFSWEERGRMVKGLLQGYTLCRKAGIEAHIVSERLALDAYDLIVVPSTQKLLAPTWEKIRAAAHRGATVYWSYFGGDYDFHQGMWCHLFSELVGTEHQLRYGLPCLPADQVTLSISGAAKASGTGPGDLTLSADTRVGGPFARSYLPLTEPQSGSGATVRLRDQAGRPALVENPLGKGHFFFLAYPWEHYLGGTADINGTDTSERLYAWLGKLAGVVSPVAPSDGRVQTHRARGASLDHIWAINRSWDTVKTQIDAEGGQAPFGPKEVRLLTIRR